MTTPIATAIATIKPRRAVEFMPEYHPPLAARTALRLDFNENTFAPSPRIIERIHKATSEDLTKYPSASQLSTSSPPTLALHPSSSSLRTASMRPSACSASPSLIQTM